VVGVVNDFHIESLKKGIQPIVLEHDPGGNLLNLRLKPDGDSGALSDFIEDAVYLWNRLHPESTFQYTFIDETFEKFAEQEQMESRGILALTAIAVLIACLGLFGLTTFTIKKREKEIGIRKILGASVAGIVNLLSKEFLWMMVLALLIAIPTAWYFIDQWLQNFAYRTDKIWWIFVSASIMSLFIAFVTFSFQGIKAALLNPVETLRNE
jgi:putative ABC transport system permease protein